MRVPAHRAPGGETEAPRESACAHPARSQCQPSLSAPRACGFFSTTASGTPPPRGSISQLSEWRLREGRWPAQGHTASCLHGLQLQARVSPLGGHCIVPSTPLPHPQAGHREASLVPQIPEMGAAGF